MQGVNKESIHKIVKEYSLVTKEEAFLCIKDAGKNLHPALRSAYIDFIISTLIDVNVEEFGTTVENFSLTFVSLHAYSTLPHLLVVFAVVRPIYF